MNQQSFHLPTSLDAPFRAGLAQWTDAGNTGRLWAKDASLWTASGEENWLGWLTLVEEQRPELVSYREFAAGVREAGFTDAVVLGMGGSSLFPEVMARTLGPVAGFPRLRILDSTSPAQVHTLDRALNLGKTLFLVASKSGSTLEPNIFLGHFYDRVRQATGDPGPHFVAITDPGTKMEQEARRLGFRHIFFGKPSVGGRFSALSPFGLAPSAIMGVDLNAFLERTAAMAAACREPDATANPGVSLGVLLGMLALGGRDKLTIVASPGIAGLGAWLEQLVAESTGKHGKAIIPVDLEPFAGPETYGDDRVFAYLRLAEDADRLQDAAIEAIRRQGQPVIRIDLAGRGSLGEEIFRWEIATAVAGALLGINPFDQPDVEASKVATRELVAAYEQTRSLPAEEPVFIEDGIALFTDAANSEAIRDRAREESLEGWMGAHLARIGRGDYFALLAYLEMNQEHEEDLQAVRRAVLAHTGAATALGFGPRFLHSTGQAYKGGPNTGVILTVTAEEAPDLPVPGQNYTFGVVLAAQARGDFQVLLERGRRALRVHLGTDTTGGLKKLRRAVETALR